MSDKIKELKDLIEHHKGMTNIWKRKAEFLANYIKENFDLTNGQIDDAWNQHVNKHWDDEQKRIYKNKIIRLFPGGKGD